MLLAALAMFVHYRASSTCLTPGYCSGPARPNQGAGTLPVHVTAARNEMLHALCASGPPAPAESPPACSAGSRSVPQSASVLVISKGEGPTADVSFHADP